MSEFFGFGGYKREPEGYFSPEHLIFVTSLMLIMTACAVAFGVLNKNKNEKRKNLPIAVCAILIDCLELFKIVMFCIRGRDPMGWLGELPLYLCSIQLITIPIAAFAKGRLREAALDFVFIFGILGAVLGTYFAGQNYSCYPVFSFDNMISGVTHSISGFVSLYIGITGMAGMKIRNLKITFSVLLSFCAAAYIANVLIDCNYMFLMRGDGTPYDILYNLVGGHAWLYPLGVVALFLVYISAYYGVYVIVAKKKN